MDGEVFRERLGAQLLTGREARTPEDVVGHLLAVQAQDPRGARLAVRARSQGLSAADVDHALSVDRSLVIGWLNRGTLHLVRSEDYWWLHALTTPPMAAHYARRLPQEGMDAADVERGIGAIRRALGSDGPLSRAEIAARLAAADVPTDGQAAAQLLGLAAAQGIVVRGPVTGGATGVFEQAYALAEDWLGPNKPVDRGVALGWLAERYLAGHGPATDRDLARWAGISLGSARAGLRATDSLTEHGHGLVSVGRRPAAPRASRPDGPDQGGVPAPRLLGAFDPVLFGWRSRADVVGPHETAIVTGGVFRAFLLVQGRAAGLWQISGRRVRIAPLQQLDPAEATALEAEEADVERFLSLRGDGRDPTAAVTG